MPGHKTPVDRTSSMGYHGPDMTSRLQSGLLLMKAVLMIVLILIAFSVQAQRPEPISQTFEVGQTILAYISQEDPAYRPGDRALAEWALEAWRKASGGTLEFEIVEEERALLRLYWVSPKGSRYGEMRPILVQGSRGAAVFVRSEVEGLGAEIDALAREDSLFRDTVVYLTCLHEIGHALGLKHSANFEDIMFFFGYGGDILNYFLRYRQKLQRREDISRHWGLSEVDIRHLRRLYPPSDFATSKETETLRD